MAKVDSVERLITGEKGIWMDLQEKPACCPCIFPPPYFKVFKDQTDSDTSNSAQILAMRMNSAGNEIMKIVEKPVDYKCGCCAVPTNPAVLVQLPSGGTTMMTFEKPRPREAATCCGLCPSKSTPMVQTDGGRIGAKLMVEHSCCGGDEEYISVIADHREAYQLYVPKKGCCAKAAKQPCCKAGCLPSCLKCSPDMELPILEPVKKGAEAPEPLGMIRSYDDKDKYHVTFPTNATTNEKLGLVAATLLLHNPSLPAPIMADGKVKGAGCLGFAPPEKMLDLL